jgi:hypothetical protein
MADEFSNVEELIAPARNVFLIAPHATNPLPSITKAIRCNVAGTITFRAVDDAADVTMTMAVGERIDVRASHVRVAGTTGTFHGLA